jgi:hypothetical protein
MIRIFTIIFAIFFLKFSNFNIFIFLKLIKIPAKFLLQEPNWEKIYLTRLE